jgi:TIR domain
MPIRIFVSHASKDEPLASALVDCLLSCIVLNDQDIRCTSVPGHKLPVGSETATTLRDELGATAVVIGLLTPNAVNSGWVPFELGATWGAKKNLVPLLAGGLSFKDLPGPLSGHHAVKLTDKNGLAQTIEEIVTKIRAKRRTSAKVDAALTKLVEVTVEYEKASARGGAAKNIQLTLQEPSIAGIPFSELARILQNDMIEIPAEVSRTPAPITMSLYDLFVMNYSYFGNGLQSNWDVNTGGGFLYHVVGLRLMPYQLVKFEKLPAAQAKWFKRMVLSPEGQKFLAHVKRLVNVIGTQVTTGKPST